MNTGTSAPPDRGGTLLLNWVFYNPVGHVAEGLKVAKGLADCNPGTAVSILLNATAPYELAKTCPSIARVYTADPRDALMPGGAAAALQHVPREWDDVVVDSRVSNTTFPLAPDLAAFHQAAEAYFVARRWTGHAYHPPETGAPRCQRDTPIRIPIGPEARAFAAAYPDGAPRIAVLMAGSSPEPIYPTLRWWTRLFRALLAAFPDARLRAHRAERGQILLQPGEEPTADAAPLPVRADRQVDAGPGQASGPHAAVADDPAARAVDGDVPVRRRRPGLRLLGGPPRREATRLAAVLGVDGVGQGGDRGRVLVRVQSESVGH